MKLLQRAAAAAFLAAALCLPLRAQAPASTGTLYQTLNYVKVPPGKGAEFVKLMSEVGRKVAERRVADGAIVSWTLLRNVVPSGTEARANYLISTLSTGAAPFQGFSGSKLTDLLKAVGVNLSAEEFLARRDSLSTLVATEIWQARGRVGAPAVGNYLVVNMMKSANVEDYVKFATTTMQPMMQHWTKSGAMTGWIVSTRVVPGGSDSVYAALTADMFPSWEATFQDRSFRATFDQVHRGKNYEQVMGAAEKLRSIGHREVWTVIDRVAK